MAPTENKMDCDQLVALTAGGLEDLDPALLAKCEEHAKGCEECRLHMAGVRAFYDSLENPGKYPKARPEVRERILRLARPEDRSHWPFRLLLLVVVASAAAFGAYEGTLRRQEVKAPEDLKPREKVDEIELPGDLDTPFQWLAAANTLIKRGKPEEAKKWLQRILDYPKSTDEIKASARAKLDEIDKH